MGARRQPCPALDGLPVAREFHVGCSGWFYWHWKGGFYGAEFPTGDWFAHYAERFKTVELNAPFYSWPTVAAVNTWVRQGADGSSFTRSKRRNSSPTSSGSRGLGRWCMTLGTSPTCSAGEMGCFLFQLPPSFQYTQSRLNRILSQLDPARRNVVEFRHRSWWTEQVYAAFRAVGAIFCSCSGPRLPDHLVQTADESMSGSTDEAVVPARLHEGGAGGVGRADSGERCEARMGVFQQRPGRLCDQKRPRIAQADWRAFDGSHSEPGRPVGVKGILRKLSLFRHGGDPL